MKKFINEGAYGCIYYPGINCNGKKIEDDMVSKIVNDSDANHEIYISKLVKNIKHYQDHFLPVEHYCNVKKKLKVKPCNAMKRHSKFKLLYIPHKKTVSTKYTVNTLYHSLLQSIQLLIQHKLVHFDIKQENIILSDKVYLIDFGLSISMKNIFSNLESAFYTYAVSYYQWPLEVHLLCYRINHGPITYERLTQICNDFVNYHAIIQKLTPRFIQEYKDQSILYFSTFLTLSQKEFIRNCIQSWKTWDNYAVTIYLLDSGYTIPPLFIKNIHYLPKERLSVSYCLTATSASGSTP